MIQLQALTHLYPSGVRAMHDVTLTITAGETLVLIGRSGCGKSTLLKILNGLVRPTSGVVCIDGQPLNYRDLPHLRRGIGYVIQHAGLFPHWTVVQNVDVLARLEHWSAARITARVAELLDLVGLDARRFAEKYPRELSGGEQQRVGVARALMLNPPIVLMDEPFNALDPLTRSQLQTEFVKWKGRLRKTIVLVTHDMPEAFLLGDRVALMEAGAILQVGPPQALANSPTTRHVAAFLKGQAS